MKKTTLVLLAVSLIFINCGGNDKKKDNAAADTNNTEVKEESSTTAAETDPMKNKGIGPVKSVTLDSEVNQEMAAKGKEVYEKMCTACHKVDKKFIGPAPAGILERRTPEWIMNMILNPQVMVKEDPIAKKLLAEYLSPMSNQNLTEKEARAVLEYFRTL
ncbi:MAG: cytochrome C [Flavobacteriales bacterium]|nr:MAG: cytochrome C [Flavobacteriales bacterium]